MPRLLLTDVVISRLRPKSGRLELWDVREEGLLLRMSPSSRVWYVRYRLPNGRRRRFKVGSYPAITVKAARAQAKMIKGRVQLEKGADPQGERASERATGRAAPRVRDLAEKFMSGHAATKLRPATVHLYELLWRRLLPELGDRLVSEVTWSDIEGLHQEFSASPALANRMLTLLSGAFGQAQRWGWYPANIVNPARAHGRFREPKVGKALTAEQLARLGAALDDEPEGSGPVAIIRVLLLCGARPAEIRGLRWAELSDDRREIDLPPLRSKTGRRSIYLAQQASRIIESRPRGEFVFASPATGRSYSNVKPTWNRVRTVSGLDCRLYDAGRHTYTTWALEANVPLERVKRLVGHSVGDITAGVYAHIRREVLLADADRVADRIQAALRGQVAEVLQFPGRAES